MHRGCILCSVYVRRLVCNILYLHRLRWWCGPKSQSPVSDPNPQLPSPNPPPKLQTTYTAHTDMMTSDHAAPFPSGCTTVPAGQPPHAHLPVMQHTGCTAPWQCRRAKLLQLCLSAPIRVADARLRQRASQSETAPANQTWPCPILARLGRLGSTTESGTGFKLFSLLGVGTSCSPPAAPDWPRTGPAMCHLPRLWGTPWALMKEMEVFLFSWFWAV